MVPFMRVPFMFMFHQSNCVSAIKRMTFYYRHTYLRALSCTCVFLVTAMSTVLCVGVNTYTKQYHSFKLRLNCEKSHGQLKLN